MKKLIIKFLIFIALISLAVIPVSVVIDPYNVFHVDEPRDNGIESNKSFIKTKYIIKHHDEFDSLLFGSSRAGFVDIGYLNDKTGGHFYDMASSESLVSEQVTELKELIDHGFVPKRVWVLVDDISCFVDPKLHENMLYRVPYPAKGPTDLAEFYLKYMDLITIKDSMKVIREHDEKRAAELASGIDNAYDSSTGLGYLDRFYHTGTERLDKVSQFDPNEEQYQTGYWCDYYKLRTDEALSDMSRMVVLCKKYDIELTVLTNPLYYLTYQTGIENGYLEYLQGLALETDYYNFSGYSDITENYDNYYETSHFTPAVTRMMIDAVVAGEDSESESYDCADNGVFGVRVSAQNVNELINLLEEQAASRGVDISSYKERK